MALILSSAGRVLADDPVVIDVPAVSASDTSSRVPTTSTVSTTDTSATSASGDSSLPADKNKSTSQDQVVTPYLPQAAANPYMPFSLNPSTISSQSPAITSSSLYTTGTTDVALGATNNALFQAFSGQAAPGFASSEQEGGYSHPPIERIRLGPIDLKAALVTTVVADDNLRQGSQNSNQNEGSKSDVYFNITPAVLLVYGAHEGQRGSATLVYSPTFSEYYHHSEEDNINQNVAFNALYPFQRLTLNVSQTYSQSTGVNTDSNVRTTQTSNVTTFGGNYVVDDKFSVAAIFQEAITSYSDPGNQQSLNSNNGGGGDEISSINTSLTYRATDKLSFGPNLNVGLDKPDNAGKQTFEQATLGVNYVPTTKINGFLQVGVELRQFDSNNNNNNNNGGYNSSGDETDPIFSGGINYTPFDSTTFSVSGSQSIHTSSVDAGQTVLYTSVGATATQRFFQRLFLNVSFNYSHSDYQNSTSGNNVNNNQFNNQFGSFNSSSMDNFSYRTSLSIAPNAWSNVAAYYQYLDNESSNSSDSYHDNQIGLSVSAQF